MRVSSEHAKLTSEPTIRGCDAVGALMLWNAGVWWSAKRRRVWKPWPKEGQMDHMFAIKAHLAGSDDHALLQSSLWAAAAAAGAKCTAVNSPECHR